MRAGHYLFFVIEVTFESSVKLVHSKGFSLSPRWLATDRSYAVILLLFLH